MIPPIVTLVAFLALASSGIAGEEKVSAKKLEIGVWRIPPGLVSSPDPSQSNGDRKPSPGLKAQENVYPVRYDATGFLKSNGVEFPPGSEAFYDTASSALVVRNTRDNLDLVDVLFIGCVCLPLNVSVEISAYECNRSVGSDAASQKWPTFRDLQQLPKGDPTLPARVSTLAKSGDLVTMSQVELPEPGFVAPSPAAYSSKAAPTNLAFLPGESGIKAAAEIVVSPDGTIIDGRLDFHFRDIRQKDVSEIAFVTSYTGWDGYPVVIHVSRSPASPEKSIVIVATTSLVNQGGWRFKTR